MERQDTLPWYKQFWPWFIISIPATAVVAGLYMLWLSLQTMDSLVVKSDAGIDVMTERNLLAEQDARRLGINAEIAVNNETGAVVVTIAANPGSGFPDSLQMHLRHPTLDTRDFEIVLSRAISDDAGNARYAGHFTTLPSGRFYLSIMAGDDWRLSGEWLGAPLTRLSALPDNEQH